MAGGGSRTGRRLLIGLVILLLVLLGLDRLGNYVAEQAAASTLKSSQDLAHKPSVDIGGFPFLTQLAAGDFDEITITAKDLPVGDSTHQLEISSLRVVLHHLTVSGNFKSVHAQTATATATVSFAELGRTLGLEVSYAGDGRITAAKQLTIAGTSLRASLTTHPELVNGALAFTQTAINNGAQLGGTVTSLLNQAVGLSIPLQGIPFHIQVTSLTVDSGGLKIGLVGRDLSYSR